MASDKVDVIDLIYGTMLQDIFPLLYTQVSEPISLLLATPHVEWCLSPTTHVKSFSKSVCTIERTVPGVIASRLIITERRYYSI